MRRGYTIMELMVSLALLAVVTSVTGRLLFTSDRALGEQSRRAAAVGGQGDLLSDLGRDLRGASAASAGGASLTVGPVSYRSTEDGVTRSVSGRDVQEYPNVQARFSRSGSLVIVALSSQAGEARTGVHLRN
ncbi:MAG: type II secretion system protein [Armatimonadota bacterium]